jgi:hypothetical protein
MFQLIIYLVKEVQYNLPFPFGKVKRFTGLIGKECVLVNVPAEGTAVYQVGMESQRIAFGLIDFSTVLHTNHLSGSNENQSPFLVIVGFADIFGRDILPYTVREIATVSALISLGGVEPMLRPHGNCFAPWYDRSPASTTVFHH